MTIRASLLLLALTMAAGGAAAQSPDNQPKASVMETDVAKIKQAMLGDWASIAPEIRPSAGKTADGSPAFDLEIQGDHAERLVAELLKAGYKAKRAGG